MPSTALALAARAGVTLGGVVPWGQSPRCDQPGVYMVSLDRDEGSAENAVSECPISATAVEKLLSVRSELTVDGKRPSTHELATRISSFWLPNETILYVGLAGTSLSDRVRQLLPNAARRPRSPCRWLVPKDFDHRSTALGSLGKLRRSRRRGKHDAGGVLHGSRHKGASSPPGS